MFKPVEKTPDFSALERAILSFWEENKIFEKRVEKNRGKEKFRFFDGPITANNPMGVHHAWGRTYKDIFQRYQALLGKDQRYQNGFDCQGLWVEVEVEKSLSLNSKKEIRDYGLDRFSEACRERVNRFAGIQTEQSKRLGQWMDWDHSYYTMSDTNIEYIWYFLKVCHDKGWLYTGHRPMPWCARCGCSLSQHETADAYEEVEHTAVFFKLPVAEEKNHFFLVWTTTPWTLAANVALAVNPYLEYVKVKQGDDILILSGGTLSALKGEYEIVGRIKGSELVGKRYEGPIHIRAREKAEKIVVPWGEVGETEGTGIVHIAPGCGVEDFELSKKEKLSIIQPVDEAGVYVDDAYENFKGESAFSVADQIFAHLKDHGHFYKIERYKHRYPHCWRCGRELIFRLVEEWFISCSEIRPKMMEASQKVKWLPDYVGKRMEDWLTNMGDWCISRKRFWGLPLPFYPCRCGVMTIVGSREELKKLSGSDLSGLRELHRPWIDAIKIRCPQCSAEVKRVEEVGDCWLDAGIIPFSTLGYLEKGKGEWKGWFPAQFVCEMREQVRLWFYSLLFMSVTLENRAPYETVLTYESVVDEKGNPFSKTKGNAIWCDDALQKMGADVMRWMYAAQPIAINLRFGWGSAKEVVRKLLTFWNVYSFFITYADIDQPDLTRPLKKEGLPELDQWMLARTNELVETARESLDQFDVLTLIRAAEKFFDDLSNWYVRRSRRRFWKGREEDGALAYRTLYEVLLTTLRVLSPVIPFMTEEIYQNLARARKDLPESIHLMDYPEPNPEWKNDALIEQMGLIQEITALGLAARSEAGLKVRRPLKCLLVHLHRPQDRKSVEPMVQLVLEEVNVKKIDWREDLSQYVEYEVKPDFSKLGPRMGGAVNDVARELAQLNAGEVAGKIEKGEGVSLRVAEEEILLSPEEIVVRRHYKSGFAGAAGRNVAVILDTQVDKELLLEGLAREVVRLVQNMRKEADFVVSDRIEMQWCAEGEPAEALEKFADYIRGETLSTKLSRSSHPTGDKVETFEIEGAKISIAVKKAG